MKTFKKVSFVSFCILSLFAFVWGVRKSLYSPLFAVREVQVVSSLAQPPLDERAILNIADIAVGDVSIFAVDFKAIEKRLLAHDWIKEVRFERKKIRSVFIHVIFRKPIAFVQLDRGQLGFLDEEGRLFGKNENRRVFDLPLITGIAESNVTVMQEALRVIRHWDEGPLKKEAFISSIQWDVERGMRLQMVYSPKQNFRSRVFVDLGSEFGEALNDKVFRLPMVFRYLNKNSIASCRIWADADKKVVVKTLHGS